MKNVIDLTDYKFKTDGANPVVIIDGDVYYVKSYSHVELIMCVFCKLIGIPCVEYQVAKKDEKLCLISKSFRQKDCRYIKGGKIINSFLIDNLRDSQVYHVNDSKKNNLETIWLALADKYSDSDSKSNDIRFVMVNLLKQYFLMILVQDADFHKNNWEIEESDEHIALSPKFDNGSAFSSMEIWGVPMGVSGEDPFETSAQSLEYFLSITASEDIELFVEMFERATPELLEQVILMVEEKYDIDLAEEGAKILTIYKKHRLELAEVLKKRGLAR